MMRPTLMLVTAIAATAISCGGSDDAPAARPSPTALPPTTLVLPTPSVIVLDPAVPLTKTYTTSEFRPAMRLRLPGDWTPVERDVSAFQTYAGDEEHELTFDHTYQQRETVDVAMERLRKTPGLRPGPITPVTMGGRRGQAFVSRSPTGSRFSDSGFHIPGGALEVMAIPLPDGTTLTVFVYSGPDPVRPIAVTDRLVRRVLASVTWR